MIKEPGEKSARGSGRKKGCTLDIWDLKNEVRKDNASSTALELRQYSDIERPRVRGDCAHIPRPCPFVSCRYHLYLDTKQGGSLVMNFPNIEPSEMTESCALDVAEIGGSNTEEIGAIMGMSRQAVHRIEQTAKAKFWASKQIQRIGREHGIELKWRAYYRSKKRTKTEE